MPGKADPAQPGSSGIVGAVFPDLKDKLGQFEFSGGSSPAVSSAPVAPAAADNVAQAMAALTGLGYTPAEARDALQKIENKNAPADELLRLALRSMAGM